NDINLIVMGAYGHSPLRRFFIGSNTTAMLEKTQIPLLMLR
ncbi:universal stress protein, partial [Cronobacter sakazakii]|nr:universal stress protein [Cronobacter sakazakii]